MTERTAGKWILPQPEGKEYVSVPQLSRTVPFGYKKDEENKGWLLPIPLELDALEEAKKYLKQYSYRQVAAWITTATGRQLSHAGLKNRIEHEQSNRRKSSTYRLLAQRYEEALRKAEEYEKRIGTEGSYFESNHFRDISSSFRTSDI